MISYKTAKRLLTAKEIRKRGCWLCLNYSKGKRTDLEEKLEKELKKNERTGYCKFNYCPYHELDKISDYMREYDQPIAEGQERALRMLFSGGLTNGE